MLIKLYIPKLGTPINLRNLVYFGHNLTQEILDTLQMGVVDIEYETNLKS